MSRLFPELDGVNDAGLADAAESVSTPAALDALLGAPRLRKSAAAPARAPNAHTPEKNRGERRVERSADDKLRARFDKILALPGKFVSNGTGCMVMDVALDGPERLRIDVAGGPIPPTSFYVLPSGSDASVAATPELSIVVGGTTSDPWIERLAQQFAIRLRKGTMELLRREINPSVAEEYDNSLGFGYSPPGAWRNFLQGHENSYGGIENSRGYCQNVTGDAIYVGHTEIECALSSPPSHDGSVAFWNHIEPDFSTRVHNPSPFAHLFSDLGEMDVIKGGTTKLDRLLDSLVRHGEHPKALVVTSTCTTTVIGDDTQGSLERLKRKLPIFTVNMAESRDVGQTLFAHAKAQTAFRERPVNPNAVNIVGLPRMDGYVGLFDVLKQVGIEVNAWLLPDIDMEQLERYSAAGVQVLHDWSTLDRAYENLLADLTLRTLRPKPPFGIAGTRAWWTAVAEAFDRTREMEQAWQRAWERIAPEWESLRAKARGYRLGFVGDERMMRSFFGSRALFGIPILDTFAEMGFGVDLYLHGGGSSGSRTEARPGSRRVVPFETPTELEALLRDAEAHAFYSEIFFDRRVTRTGKNVFSVRDFGRVGLDGALSTLRRLVAACEMPFYRSYARYLGPAFDATASASEKGPE